MIEIQIATLVINIMIRNPWLKVGVVLVCMILLHAQEQPAPSPHSIPAEVVDAAASVPPPADSSNANEVKPQTASTPGNIVQVAPTVVEPIVQTPPQVVQPLPIVEKAELQQQTNENPVSAEAGSPPKAAPVSTQNQAPTQNGLQNLTEQQKKQLLHQQSIRSQLHSNDSLKLSDLTNMTVQQHVQMQKRFAEESRLAYERAMKQLEERKAKEREENQRLMKEQTLSYSQDVAHNQRQRIKKSFDQDVRGLAKFANEYLFDMQPNTEEQFMISLPVAQRVGFLIVIYTNQDGVYVKNKLIDGDRPMNIMVHENNNRPVYQSSFFFTEGRLFDGKADCTYSFRFENQDKHRLISFRVTGVLEKAQIQSKLKAQDMMSHYSRSDQLFSSIKDKLYGFNQEAILQASNKRRLSQEIRTYYIYNCFEIIIFIVTVLVQIEMIRRLLGSSSIV